jgi:hypothetical protein
MSDAEGDAWGSEFQCVTIRPMNDVTPPVN